MKAIRYLSLACLAGTILVSCGRKPDSPPTEPESGYRLVRLHYENAGGERGVTHYYYDTEGRDYLAVWHLLDSSRSSLNHRELDSAGRMLVKSRQFSDGISSVQHYRYNPDGNLVGEDFSRSDGVKGQVEYGYDGEGKLVWADCNGLNGWFYGRIEYTWEDGMKTGARLLRDSVPIGTIEYQYENGRLVREHWDFNGTWSQTFRYEYQEAAVQTYTSSNVFIRESPWFRVAREDYDFNGQSGGPSFYTYDADGKLVSKEFIRSDGLRTVTTYEYDSTGLLDRSHREYDDGRQTEFLYWYSVERKLLVRTFQWSDGNSGSEAYRYEEGLLAQGEWENVDGWLNGILLPEYDSAGLMTGAVFKGEDGVDATLEFGYDRDFNLVRINWEFSSGHTQTYRFVYEACGSFTGI